MGLCTPPPLPSIYYAGTLPNATWCPWTYYRSSGDINSSWNSVIANLNTVFPLAAKNLSTPQCWAYPDMSEVGHPGLSPTEWRTHYAAWAIVSSPQIIGMDMTDTALVQQVWPIISNVETKEVQQAYFGFSGSQFQSAAELVDLCTPAEREAGEACQAAPSWMALYKPIDAKRTAVLVINNAAAAADLTVSFAAVPDLPCGTTCKVRDIFAQKDKGSSSGSYTVQGVASHDSVFVMLSA